MPHTMVPTVYTSHDGASLVVAWYQGAKKTVHTAVTKALDCLPSSLSGLQNRTAVARLSWLEDVDYRLTNSRHTIKQEAFKCSMRLFFLTHLMCTIQASITTTKIPTWRWKKKIVGLVRWSSVTWTLRPTSWSALWLLPGVPFGETYCGKIPLAVVTYFRLHPASPYMFVAVRG